MAEVAAYQVEDLKDFPEKYDPMVVKELRQGLQQPFFLIPFIAIHFFAIGALGMEWMAIQSSLTGSGSGFNEISQSAFWFVCYVIVGLIMPLRGFNALQEESQQGNTELLLLSGLTRWRIVRGKWKVQMLLSGLTIISLLPHLLVRYFFGAFDFWANLMQLAGVFCFTMANAGLVIGASGYRNYSVRLSFLGFSLLYTVILAFALQAMAINMGQSRGLESGMMIFSCIVILGIYVFYAIAGMQLGRGHLRLFLVPWEPVPTRTMASLVLLSPPLLLAGGLVTLGFGIILVVGILIFCVIMYDRTVNLKPIKSSPAPPRRF